MPFLLLIVLPSSYVLRISDAELIFCDNYFLLSDCFCENARRRKIVHFLYEEEEVVVAENITVKRERWSMSGSCLGVAATTARS